MKRRPPLDAWLRALVLVRLGQELGTASPLSRAICDVIDAVISALR